MPSIATPHHKALLNVYQEGGGSLHEAIPPPSLPHEGTQQTVVDTQNTSIQPLPVQNTSALTIPASPEQRARQQQQKEDPGFWGTLGDMGKGIGAGTHDAVAETLNLVSDGANLLLDDTSKMGNIMDPSSIQLNTGWGKAAKGVSQFVVGLVGAGKFLKAAKLLQGAGKAVTFGRGMAQGAIADFTVFDANEERLSNLIQSNDTLANPITEFLAADKDDSAAMGRFKNTLEGMILGATGEALFTIVKGIKATRTAKTVTEAEDAIIHTADELETLAAKSGQTTEEVTQSIDAVMSGDSKALVDALEQSGGKVDVHVTGLEAGKTSTSGFRSADAEEFITLRSNSKRPEFLTPYTAEEMKGWKHFVTDDGVGFTLTDKMDIVGVLNNSGKKGAGQEAVIEAVAQGGKSLDCIGGMLSTYYKKFGFTESNRLKWDDQYAPKGWNYDKYGRQDIIFFEYPAGLSRNSGDIRRRFENAGGGEPGRGPMGPKSGGGRPQQPATGIRQGVGEGEQSALGRGTGISEHFLTSSQPPKEAPHSISGGASSGSPLEVNVHGVDEKTALEALESLSPTPAIRGAATKAAFKPEEMEKIISAALSEGRGIKEILDGEYLIGNTGRIEFETLDELRLHGEYAVKAFEKTLKGKGTQAHSVILDNSSEWLESMSLSGLLDAATHDKATMRDLAARAVAYKMGSKSAGQKLLDIQRAIDLQGASPELLEQFEKASRTFQDLSLAAKDITTTGARITSAGRIKAEYMKPELLSGIVKATEGDPEKILKILNASRTRKAFNTLQEIVINGLLSSPKTHLVNITGNLMKSALMPAEKMIGGVLMGNRQMVVEGAQTYVGLSKYLGESWKAAKMAMKMGDNILDRGHKVMDAPNQTLLGTYEKIKKDILSKRGVSAGAQTELNVLEELQARSMSFIGLPSRALLGMDEWFKQLNYRANSYAKLAAEGMTKFGDEPLRIAEFIENGMSKAFDAAGRGMDEAALRYGQEATWTQSLKDGAYFDGGLGQGVSNFVNQYPPLRLVMPFVRTPTNLIRDFIAHTPGLNMVTKKYRDAIAAGGERAAHAYGQTATGALLWTTAIGMASTGKMTGGYPKDPATRQAWIDSGIEPYSFRIGDTYISFARLDPFSTFFGIAADYAEYSRNWNDSAKGNWASGAVLSLGNNILSKSYLTGLTDLIDALGDQSVDSTAMQRYMQRAVTMFIPYSSGLRFTRQMTDDSMREVRSGFDAILNILPSGSSLLPERRSWLTGKAVSHNVFWGEHKNDVVTNEIARLGDNLSLGAPGKKLKGVLLSGEQYSRLCELQGTTKIGGMTQYERLTRLMKSPSYDRGRKKIADMPGDMENPRTRMVEKVVTKYRQAAQKQLVREDNNLRSAVERELKTRIAARRGDAAQVQELLTMPK